MNEQNDIQKFFKLMNHLRTAGRQHKFIQSINQINTCMLEAQKEANI